MYAAGFGIKPWRAPRADGYRSVRRLLAAVAAVSFLSIGFALGARGGSDGGYTTTVVVQPGDTLWAIAADRYPNADTRDRVDEIERANGLGDAFIQPGQSLRVPTS